MLKYIRVFPEYGAYPVWLYDEDGDVIDTLLPEELRSDTFLDSLFDDLQERYNALFVDNKREFSFRGFSSEEERDKYIQDWNKAVTLLKERVNPNIPVIEELNPSTYDKFF